MDSSLERAITSISQPGQPLDRVVDALVRVSDGLDQAFEKDPALLAELHQHGNAVAAASFNGDAGAMLQLQLTLRVLVRLALCQPGRSAELSWVLYALTNRLSDAWLGYLRSRLATTPVPRDPAAFELWFRSLIDTHPAADHALYSYLESRASVDALRVFLAHESTIDGNFIDLLAMTQVGTTGPAKQEILHNIWDEMGEGSSEHAHPKLFGDSLSELDVDPGRVDLSWPALACSNLLGILARSRYYYLESIGALAATEAAVPNRFTRILRGARRLGLSDRFCSYYATHVRDDEEHAGAWLAQVICPAIANNPHAAERVATGAQLRLLTSQDYCEALTSMLVEGGR